MFQFVLELEAGRHADQQRDPRLLRDQAVHGVLGVRVRQRLPDRLAVRQATGSEDPAEREDAVHRLIAEETRLTLLVGVAAGLELAYELEHPTEGPTDR